MEVVAQFEATKIVSHDSVLKQPIEEPNLSAKIGVKSLLGGGAISKQSDLSAKIGVKSLLGGVGAILKILKQPNLSAKIGVKLFSGVGSILKQPNLLARAGVKLVVVGISQTWTWSRGGCRRFHEVPVNIRNRCDFRLECQCNHVLVVPCFHSVSGCRRWPQAASSQLSKQALPTASLLGQTS